MELTDIQQRFVLHWGEMGARWGVNRTVAQVHALLFISPRPLHAEEITQTLSVARSNISTSLRELQSWGIVKVVHVMGDRRDHFESRGDVWEMFRIIIDERKRREVDPTLEMLRECTESAPDDSEADRFTQKRLTQMREFFEVMTTWYQGMRSLPTGLMIKTLKTGPLLKKLVGAGRK